MSNDSPSTYRERLWPSPGLMIALLLLLPAVAMVMTPINATFAIPTAIAVYVLIAGSLVLMSPVVQVVDGVLSAGSARVPVSALGEVQELDDAKLRKTIGPGADARAYLLVRGFIHRGLRIELPHASGREVPMVRNPLKFSATPLRYERAAPVLGEHTRDVLIAVLGLDAAGIDALQADGVVQAANPTGTGATR